YLGLFRLWMTIFPCPILPLAGHSRLGQNTLEASIWLSACGFILVACQMSAHLSSFLAGSLPVRGVIPASSPSGGTRATEILACSSLEGNIRGLGLIPSNIQVIYHLQVTDGKKREE